MFSLLAPFALWLAPLAAVPFVLALMGRAQPHPRDFPSLLPVRASLQQAMKRHRLKNWLQIILRTLLILCLLLAAAGLQWRGRHNAHALPPPRTSGMLWHNGVYALTPASSGETSILTGHRLGALRAALDSLAHAHGGRTIVEPVVPPGTPGEGPQDAGEEDPEGGLGGAVTARAMPAGRQAEFPAVARYGAPPEAAARLLRGLGAGGGGETHAFIPVFAARDLVALAPAARSWLEANPDARLVLIDHGAATARLAPFAHDTALTPLSPRTGSEARGQEDMMTLRVTAAGPQGFSRAPVWRPARSGTRGTESAQDMRLHPARDEASLTLRLPATADGARWVAGTIALPPAGPARPEAAVTEHPVAYRIPPPATLCHVGSRDAFVSLASLGEGGERLHVRTLEAQETAAASATACHLLYLADPPAMSSALLAQAATVLRAGGTVILEAGRHTDAALWNRHLLAPLDVGRLTVVIPEAAAVRAVPAGLGAAGLRAEHWGRPGAITARFGFQAHPATHILLRADAESPGAPGSSGAGGAVRSPPSSPPAPPAEARETPAVLVERRVGSGRLLLWTTSLSDPEWSDLGLGPWPALIHQGLYADAWAAGIQSRHTHTDSLVWWPATADAPMTAPRVTDPEGNPFRRVRADAGGWWIGPFDHAGLYRMTEGGVGGDNTPSGRSADAQSGWLAVRLAPPPRAPGAADWEAFREALGPDAWARVVRLEDDDDWRTLYEGVNLRFALLVLAALLLFAEGVLSLRLAHDSRR